MLLPSFFFFFFNDTATTEIYTLSLHDALPIYAQHHDPMVRGTHPGPEAAAHGRHHGGDGEDRQDHARPDRKSTRLNSSHGYISYAVFCLKKKNRLLDGCPVPTHSRIIERQHSR